MKGTDVPLRVTVRGGSILPLIRPEKDYVTIVPVHDVPKRGDIILYYGLRGNLVLHRLCGLKGNTVKTRGDNCIRADAWFLTRHIVGVAKKVERGQRTIELDNAKSRTFGRIWMSLLPIRVPYYILRRGVGKALRIMGRRR